ncbi:uncharacterized protein [Diabrotica undecimpunctata]|uniref:uncharacterized protein n=1 Tax=Diabrotica undecimpunctata TaxID=50387 RepID=UPI003B640214
MKIEALVLRKITKNLPEKEIQMKERNHRNLVLADPNFNETGSIDILLGAKEYSLILLDGVDRTKNGLLAQNTKLGWIMSGIAQQENIPNIQVLSMISRRQIDEEIKKYWELKEVDQSNTLSVEEKECEGYYNRTVKRDNETRFEVKIPVNSNRSILGGLRQQA